MHDGTVDLSKHVDGVESCIPLGLLETESPTRVVDSPLAPVSRLPLWDVPYLVSFRLLQLRCLSLLIYLWSPSPPPPRLDPDLLNFSYSSSLLLSSHCLGQTNWFRQ